MPPVTRPDLGVLPVVSAPPPGPGAVRRPVVSRTDAPKGLEGEGFPVHRALAGVDLRELLISQIDPFCLIRDRQSTVSDTDCVRMSHIRQHSGNITV